MHIVRARARAHTHTQMEGELEVGKWAVAWSEHMVSITFQPWKVLSPSLFLNGGLTHQPGAPWLRHFGVARGAEWQEPCSPSPPLKGSPKTWPWCFSD